MATVGIVVPEEHIECTVCFEVYRNPHALPCLHTFCKECINQLEKHGKVECPHCREVCNVKQVRKDFKTQALIDSHNAKPQEVPGEAGSLCGMCGEQRMDVVSHCASCDHVMCAKCQGIHAKMKATKSHSVQSLRELLAKAKAPFHNAINMLKRKKTDYDSSSENIASTLRRIHHDKEDKIRQVDAHFEKIRTSIHQKIKIVYAHAIDILTENKALTDKNARDIERQINFLMEITGNNDLSTLKTMESQLKSMTDEAQTMRKFQVMTSPVNLQLRDIQPETIVDVVVAESILNPKQIQFPKGTALEFCKIATQKYKKVGSVETEEYIQRMRMIGGQLYCAAGKGGIHIYNTDLTLIREITSDKLNFATSVAHCEQTGDLIVACRFKGQGVHQLTSEGDYITSITVFGMFSDVCSHHGRVFALDYDECKIRVFEKSIDVWSETVSEQIQLTYLNVSQFDKLLVTEDRAFVSSCENGCVYEYRLSSRQRLRQFGRRGQSGPGALSSPLICDIDTQGCIMICDWGNKRVQVCECGRDRGGEESWHCLTLPGLEGDPVDAVVGRDGHTLWVATYNPQELIKYKM